MKRSKLVDLLVERGFFADPKDGVSWITMGKVLVDGRPVTKPWNCLPCKTFARGS